MRRRHSGSMLFLVMLCSLCLVAADSAAEMVKLKGSGASFPFPLYGRWFKDYGKVNKQVQVDYQAKGSGAGIKDFVNKTVDFAASDAAMSDEDIAAVDVGVQLLPMRLARSCWPTTCQMARKTSNCRARSTAKSFWVRS